MKKVYIDNERCKGCMLCTYYCPKKILLISDRVNQDGYKVAVCANDETCIGCLSCAAICPSTCFEIYKEQPVVKGG
jgi:2-oxoglutarate ferredoxin oxidoreductase subunit delta